MIYNNAELRIWASPTCSVALSMKTVCETLGLQGLWCNYLFEVVDSRTSKAYPFTQISIEEGVSDSHKVRVTESLRPRWTVA